VDKIKADKKYKGKRLQVTAQINYRATIFGKPCLLHLFGSSGDAHSDAKSDAIAYLDGDDDLSSLKKGQIITLSCTVAWSSSVELYGCKVISVSPSIPISPESQGQKSAEPPAGALEARPIGPTGPAPQAKPSVLPAPQPRPSAQPAPLPTNPPAPQSIPVGDIQKLYEINAAAADAQYKGKRLKLVGTIERITTHLLDSKGNRQKNAIEVCLQTGFPYTFAFFAEPDQRVLAKLGREQAIEFVGTIDGLSKGSSYLHIKDCTLLHPQTKPSTQPAPQAKPSTQPAPQAKPSTQAIPNAKPSTPPQERQKLGSPREAEIDRIVMGARMQEGMPNPFPQDLHFIKYQNANMETTYRYISDIYVGNLWSDESIVNGNHFTAYCYLRKERRSFRADRVISAINIAMRIGVDPYTIGEIAVNRYNGAP
jgi:hypothetical protein